ncbi:MAG: hypothetical protein EXR72_05020 [Myxococcales bacterium]|nr:hypothetical protein [Myxococcales bacterium]
MKIRYSFALAAAALAPLACNQGTPGGNGGGTKDLSFVFNNGEDGGAGADGGDPNQLNNCGDKDPSCQGVEFDPDNQKKFPLSSDKPPDPNQSNDGVGRDASGYLVLDSTHASFDFLWVANSGDWNKGTTSKINSKTIREVARYFTVTCNSLKSGNQGPCDGKNGCCAMDSNPQFMNRKGGQASGSYQAVNLMNNMPSRTAIDFDGNMWIANRAFSGQSSATKIANDTGSCIDRNGNGKIDTSKDSNGDGLIQTDCNTDGQPDDLASVKKAPCTNGMAQEFYGLDDECVLFTTNTGSPMQYGRPLSLGPGAQDFGPSDAWAGTYNDGKFFRIDGTTGMTKDVAVLPQQCKPYGLVVDSSGYGWSPNLSQAPLCYFNTKKTSEVGAARTPTVGQLTGYGVGLDRDQNIWVACLSFGTCRYTPDRKNGFAGLGNGYWTMIQKPGGNNGNNYGIGIAVDARSANQYFAWQAGGSTIVRIPASDLKLPKGQDVLVDGAMYPSVPVAGDGKGVGVDREQNIWNIGGSGYATRVQVDVKGQMTMPDLVSPPMGNNKCPGGDRCYLKDNNASSPSPYTYSDFTGFGLRNFTRPHATWSYIAKGCVDGVDAGDTKWMAIKWDAEIPLNTKLSVHVRSGKTSKPDLSWGQWSPDFSVSPADLMTNMPLVPNEKDDGYLQVEVNFATMAKDKGPKLKSLGIYFECGIPTG